MPDAHPAVPYTAPLKPEGVDIDQPSAARAYDYYLGGNANFQADRDFGDMVLSRVPFVRDFARDNRAFLRRAVTFLCDQGVDQFLDIGSGIPTVGNVHDVAQHANPEARTLYVDYEPVAVAHTNTILDETDPSRERTAVLRADLRDPESILKSRACRELLDFERPIGLLIVATMHFVGPGDQPTELIAEYRDALPSGSYIVLSHLTLDGVPEQTYEQGVALKALYANTANPGYERTYDEFMGLCEGFDLVEPGVVWGSEWRPEYQPTTNPASTATLVAVGRKP